MQLIELRMKLKTRTCVLVSVIISTVIFTVIYFIAIKDKIKIEDNIPFYRDRNVTMMEINNNLLMARLQDRRRDGGDGVSCKHPVLDIFDEAIMKFFPPSPKPDCPSEPPWVHLRGDKVVVDQNLVRERYIRCIFSEVLRETEDLNRQGPVYSTDKEHKFRLSDFVVVGCTDRHENKWGSVIAGGWRNEKVVSTTGWQLLSPDGLPVNVLIWGYDSISRNTFIRKLPKTYEFLIEALGGMVLKGYNIVGDGTARAIIPMMTGKTEIELPDARRRMGDAASSVDVYPFIWKKFKSRGYVTGYLDDRPEIGTFQLNLKGFNKTPTDLYTRPLYLTRERLGLSPRCHHGNSTNFMAQEYFKAAWEAYVDKPKFFFALQSQFSHDEHNAIGILDQEMLDFFKWFHDNGHLNQTILIVMSDHGHRFAAIRETHQGKLEERMPFFYFRFPEWMRSRYPKALKNFEENADLLSTPFDVHETLADILHFKSLDFDAKIEDDDGSMPRGISLFRRVPRGRTCTDAAIEAHWCACLQWEPLETESNQARDVANAVLKVINEYNAQQLTQFRATPGVEQDMCAIWQLAKVVWATRFASNSKILQFSKTKDADHFHAKLDASTKPAVEIYQISLTAEPGNGQFEATAHFNVENKSYKIEISHVSRINKYGTQAGCVVDQLHQLRQFCNCLKG